MVRARVPRSNRIFHADNLEVLPTIEEGSVDLIYIDPPFNTGGRRTKTQIRVRATPDGDRMGFGGRRYATQAVGRLGFDDLFDDYLAFLEPRLREARRVLAEDGSIYVHLDPREVHYCKVLMDRIFGRESFLNEIIWAYDFGGRSRRYWPRKHDDILLYVKDPKRYCFDAESSGRIPYLAPGLVGPEKARRGKLPTDTWWQTIVPTSGKEKTGYPTQKPLAILRRIIATSSREGDHVLDFFAGSGTTGAACLELGRRFTLIDNNPAAIETMSKRFRGETSIEWIA